MKLILLKDWCIATVCMLLLPYSIIAQEYSSLPLKKAPHSEILIINQDEKSTNLPLSKIDNRRQNAVITEDYLITPDRIGYDTNEATYCTPFLDCEDGDVILNVTFADINNDSACSSGGYGDYTSIDTEIIPGETYPISVTVGDGWFSESVSVWIDYNQDGVFDSDEFYYIGTGSDEVLTGSIAIPSDLDEGEYLLRVRVAADGPEEATYDKACDEDQFFGETEDYTLIVSENSNQNGDCDQGDDGQAEVEDGFNIADGSGYENADDFFVSAGNTLEIEMIELSILSTDPVDEVDLIFYEDDDGVPGTAIIEIVTGIVPTSQNRIGSEFGFNHYSVYLDVNLEFVADSLEDTRYWMSPVAFAQVGIPVFWEVTSSGTLGNPIHTREQGGEWVIDENDSHGVFKLYCEAIEIPEEECLFDITSTVEPITRVVFGGIDNTSSPIIDGSPALEDFSDIEGGVLHRNQTAEIILEGNTDGDWENYFTVFIDWNRDGEWSDDEVYELGSIQNSTGEDGVQLICYIEVPENVDLGEVNVRIIKNWSTSPTDPCGIYNYGQAEDYILIVEEEAGIESINQIDYTYYPNPVKEKLFIHSDEKINRVEIYNLLGKKLMTFDGLENGGLDLTNLAIGNYIGKVYFEDNISKAFKIIKE